MNACENGHTHISGLLIFNKNADVNILNYVIIILIINNNIIIMLYNCIHLYIKL